MLFCLSIEVEEDAERDGGVIGIFGWCGGYVRSILMALK